ncbi:MAG: hypothetical protein R6V05_11385 [Candidatus Brocadiia bacterium]
MGQRDWKVAVVVLLAVVAGGLLAGGGWQPGARAQSEGSAGGVICVIGQERSGDAPIVLVDVPDQTIVIYEYSYSADRVTLASVRSFRYDKRMRDWQTDGPSVTEVQEYVRQLQSQGR